MALFMIFKSRIGGIPTTTLVSKPLVPGHIDRLQFFCFHLYLFIQPCIAMAVQETSYPTLQVMFRNDCC